VAKLKLGVIGAGSWAVASHLPNLAKRPEVAFTAVCRHGADALLRIKQDWGFSRASEDFADVLDAQPDIVVVSSPAALHYEHAKAALLAGAHVMVEKPFTISSADAWDLVETATAMDRHLVVALGYNHKPMVAAAAAFMFEAGVGAVEQLAIAMCSGTRTLLTDAGAYVKAASGFAPEPGTWTDPALSGGGYAQAQLSHALGIGLYLTGLRAREVYALTYRPDGARVEINDAAAISYVGGAIGTLSGASAHPGYLAERDLLRVNIVGSEAQLDLDFQTDTVSWHSSAEGTRRADLPPGAGSYDCDGPPNRLVDLALGLTDDNPSPGELGARSVEVVEALYASAADGRAVRITPPVKETR
jgi:predicted dehydrogenase